MKQEVKVIKIKKQDLPLHCPVKGQELWCEHPRVFLSIEESGSVVCPYCGTKYELVS